MRQFNRISSTLTIIHCVCITPYSDQDDNGAEALEEGGAGKKQIPTMFLFSVFKMIKKKQ